MNYESWKKVQTRREILKVERGGGGVKGLGIFKLTAFEMIDVANVRKQQNRCRRTCVFLSAVTYTLAATLSDTAVSNIPRFNLHAREKKREGKENQPPLISKKKILLIGLAF